jgi:hypothetical protein
MNETKSRILQCISRGANTVPGIAIELGFTQGRVRQSLRSMLRESKVQIIKKDFGREPTRWALKP